MISQKTTSLLTICLTCFFLLPEQTHAVVWRADLTKELTAQQEEMTQVGKLLYSPLRVLGGSCVALGGKWVLTSRHGTSKWQSSDLRVTFPALGKTVYAVERIVYPKSGDFALLELKTSVSKSKPLFLYKGKDEVGKQAWIGGFGLSGPVGKAHQINGFHGGHNRIDSLTKGKLSISLSKLEDKDAEPDEAILALMDSGSPLFVKVDGKWQLAGIASTASNGAKPSYGDRGNYARVRDVVEWIEHTTK